MLGFNTDYFSRKHVKFYPLEIVDKMSENIF